MDGKFGNFELILPKHFYFYILTVYEKEIDPFKPQICDLDELTYYDIFLMFEKKSFFKNILLDLLYNQIIYYNTYLTNGFHESNEIIFLPNLKKDLYKYAILLNTYLDKYNENEIIQEFHKIIKNNYRCKIDSNVLKKIKKDELNNVNNIKIQLNKNKEFYKVNKEMLFDDICTNICNTNLRNKDEFYIINNHNKFLKNNLKLKLNESLLFIYLIQMSILNMDTNHNLMKNIINIFDKYYVSKKLPLEEVLKQTSKVVKQRDNLINNDIITHKKLIEIYMKKKNWYMNNGFCEVMNEISLNEETILKWWKLQNKIYNIKLKNKLYKNEVEREEYWRFGDLYFEKKDFPDFYKLEKNIEEENNILNKKFVENVNINNNINLKDNQNNENIKFKNPGNPNLLRYLFN